MFHLRSWCDLQIKLQPAFVCIRAFCFIKWSKTGGTLKIYLHSRLSHLPSCRGWQPSFQASRPVNDKFKGNY